MPLVSVVIPTFNRRDLVVEAVASVLSQRGADLETIVIDDGSTDGTEEALAPLADRLCYLRRPQSGVAAARNAGVRASRGEWVAFLDSDDLWRPGKLAAQMRYHEENPDCRVSQTGAVWIRNGVRVNPCAHHGPPSGDILLASLERCLVSASAVILRRDLFDQAGGFDEGLTVCEDYDLWLRVAARESVGLIADPLVIRRGGHADQLSRAHWGMDRFRVAALVRLIACAGLAPVRRRAAVEVLRRKCAILAKGARSRGREEEAERYLALAGCFGDPGGRAAVACADAVGSSSVPSARTVWSGEAAELCC